MRNTTKVQELVYSMLTENTGSHFLDSGGAYGRNHERNAKKTIEDFMREDEESYQFDGKYIHRTVSVFHYLSGLDLNEICEEFNKLNDEDNNWEADADVYGVGTKAWNWLTQNHEVEVERTFNTYNGDSDLSQILQGSHIEIDGDSYYLIQVHGGCDARGGYTDAKLFKTAMHVDGIHEYLWDYKHDSEIINDLEEGYIPSMVDYYNKEKKYTAKKILKLIKTK